MERASETKTPTLVGRIEGMLKAALTYRKLAFADRGTRVFCELKAIEVANALLAEGIEEGKAIRIAIAAAKGWAEHHAFPVHDDE